MPDAIARSLRNAPFGHLLDDERLSRVDHWFSEVRASAPALAERLADGVGSESGLRWWRALCASSFLRSAALLEPATALCVLDRQALPANELSSLVAQSTDEATRQLRQHRRRQMLAIGWRDLADEQELSTTLTALSDLADGCLMAASGVARQQMRARFGELRDAEGEPVPLHVICMGKLGGRELNYSSDIDIMFTFPRDGESDGRRALAASEYGLREARLVVDLIHRTTADGRVFRVDTRLRPFGEAGPLAISFDALERYLQTHGRDWERYAFVKARFLPNEAASTDEAAQFEQSVIAPFVYRRYLDFGVLESLRDMKQLIAGEVARRDLNDHLKLGPGGIREIEFIAQSLQLIRGGQNAALRTRSIYEALSAGADSGELSEASASALRTAYDLLRKAENALQAIEDQQVHALPEDPELRASLVLAMGADSWSALVATLDEHRHQVSAEFDAMAFHTGADAPDEARTDWLALSREALGAAVQALGFEDANDIETHLVGFRTALARMPLDAQSRARVIQFVDLVMHELSTRSAPAIVLSRLLAIVGAVARRSAYLALLIERPAARTHLVELAASSDFLARQVAEHPMLLDALLDPVALAEPITRSTMTSWLDELEAALAPDDSEAQVQALVRFAKSAWFRVAVADNTGALPLMRVSDRLTDVAEIILQRVLEIAWRDVTARHGAPAGCDLSSPRFAIVAYGKLGGWELGYGSDLDIVFLHDMPQGETTGPAAVDNTVFAARLARRIVHLLAVQTGDGHLYEVDTRLRPSGRSGLLVSSLSAFERYQREDAWTWEHQALTRARPVAGDASIAARFNEIRLRTLSDAVRRDTLASDVTKMRARMRRELSSAEPGQFDIKQDRGGVADLEFLVQYLVLAHVHKTRAVADWTDNIRQLDSLVDAGVLAPNDAADLQSAYRAFRAVVHQRALDRLSGVVDDSELRAPRETVARLWDNTFAT